MKHLSCLPALRRALSGTALTLLIFSASSAVRADEMYIWAEETGGNVVFHFQGSIDTTGFPAASPIGAGAGMVPSGGALTVGDVGFGVMDLYAPVTPPAVSRTFGTGVFVLADSDTGDNFGIDLDGFLLPPGYISGTVLSGSMIFNGATFASLGVDTTPFSYNSTVGTNTVFMFTTPGASASGSARADLQIGKSWNRLKGDNVYQKRRPSPKQTIVRPGRVFTTNTAKACLLLENDGGTAAQLKLRSIGDTLPRMDVSAFVVSGGRQNISADLKRGGYRTTVAPGDPVRIVYRLRTDRFYAGVFRDGDRDDTVLFRLTGGGSADSAALVRKYR